MPWTCRLIDLDALRQQPGPLKQYLTPGDLWFAPWLTQQLSPEYVRDWQGKRPPLVMHLPDGSDWVVDGIARNMNGHGWTVTGEPPLLTASPSIGKYNSDGSFSYHGWLRDGVLSDDIDGRSY